MFHPLLQKQFADFLGGLPSADHPLQAFFNSISDTYHQFEKNAGSTQYVEQPNAEKPKPFDDLASFPLENPILYFGSQISVKYYFKIKREVRSKNYCIKKDHIPQRSSLPHSPPLSI